MKSYADTNFFCGLYLKFDESEITDGMLSDLQRAGAEPVPATWLIRMGLINSFQRYVFEARAGGRRVTPEIAAAAQAQFLEDLRGARIIRAASLPLDALEDQFESLALRHTAKHGFRTYDILHVASALALKCDTFWSFDVKARKLATLEGLKTN